MNNPHNHNVKKHPGRDDLAGEYKYGDAGQILLFGLFCVALLLDLLWLELFEEAREAVSFVVRISLSIPLFICSLLLFRSSHREIFDIEREQTTVIASGAYGIVRHPMYLGSILLYLAVLVLSLSVAALAVWVLTLAFYYYISRYEERILVKALGAEYDAYRARVPMFIPRFNKAPA